MKIVPDWIRVLFSSAPAEPVAEAAPRWRRFEGAQVGRLLSSWQSAERSINTELRADLDALRRRCRDLAKNEPLAARYLSMCQANIVGAAGFGLQARVTEGERPDKLANDSIERAWKDWTRARNCDITGRMSFAAMTRAVVRAVARDGEALVMLHEGADNPHRFALQLLDIERLATWHNTEAGNGRNAVRMGVEFAVTGRPVAYWLADNPIGADPAARKLRRIEASALLHIFITDDPEQARGIPWMHASMVRVHHLKGFQEAAIIAARIGASKMGFFTNVDGDPGQLGDGEDADGIPFAEVQPGQFGALPPGYDFKIFDPAYPHAHYDAFVKAAKRDIASGFDAAYHSLANDLEGVNFSSIRAGTLDERDQWMTLQRWLIDDFLEPVYEAWLSSALLAGAIVTPAGNALPYSKREKFSAHEFMGRRWAWVDPLKDIEASIKAIDAGLASPYTIAAQQGLDAEDVLADIARWQAAARLAGVELRQQPPAAPPQPREEPEEDDPADNETE